MFINNKQQANRTRRVAFYGRVSTEHEEQMYALKNQMQWYEELCRYFPNWHIVPMTVSQAHKQRNVRRFCE